MIELLKRIHKELDGAPRIILYDGLPYKVLPAELADELVTSLKNIPDVKELITRAMVDDFFYFWAEKVARGSVSPMDRLERIAIGLFVQHFEETNTKLGVDEVCVLWSKCISTLTQAHNVQSLRPIREGLNAVLNQINADFMAFIKQAKDRYNAEYPFPVSASNIVDKEKK